MFKKAERHQLKARIALDGPSGSGKTYSALRAAYSFGMKGAVIDTEHGAASKYIGERPDGYDWQFDTLELTEFNPATYTKAINEASQAGYDWLIIDSLSHSWVGAGGALEMVDNSGEKNSYFAWGKITPIYRRMFDAILACKCHVIATMRTKTDYVVEKNERGQNVPKKIGTAPVIRDGMEYEFDVVGDIDIDHNIKITKSRCSKLQDASCAKPGAMFWAPLVEWLALGVAVQPITKEQHDKIYALAETLALTPEKMERGLQANFYVDSVHLLTTQQADQMIDRLNAKLQPA